MSRVFSAKRSRESSLRSSNQGLRSKLALSVVLTLCGVLAGGTAQGQIAPTTGPRGLDSRVTGGACSSGFCAVTGGTSAGGNLFHRFDSFDTRNGITGVSIDSRGKGNVIMGVIGPAGTFLDKTVNLTGKANLFWLSPGGISITGGGGFRNVNNLSLSTAPTLRFGGVDFDVFNTTKTAIEAVGSGYGGAPSALLRGADRAGDIVLSSGLLEVDGDLLLDAATLTTRGQNTVSGPWTLSLDTWTNEGRLLFADGGSVAFSRPATWTNTADGVIGFGVSPAKTFVAVSPFQGVGVEEGATAPGAVVQGPADGRVILRNFGEIYKSTDSTQILSRVDLRNLASDTAFYPPPNDRLRKADPVYTGRIEITDGTLVLDENSRMSEQTGSIFLLSEGALELRGGDPLVNEGFIGGVGTVRVGAGGDGTLENRGVLAPGLRGAVGQLDIQGDVVQPRNASAAAIDVDIGDSQFDVLNVSGRVDLQGGSIEANLLEGYTPRGGDSFKVVRASGGLAISPDVKEVLPTGIISVVEDNTTYGLLAGAELSEKQLFFLTRSRDDATLLGEQLSLLAVTLDQASFSLGALTGPEGPLGSIGATTTLDPLETQQQFLEDEGQARITTQNRLGLTDTMGEGSLSPAEVQQLLRRAADEVRGDCRERGTC